VYFALEPVLTSCERIPVTAPRIGNRSTVSKPVPHNQVLISTQSVRKSQHYKAFTSAKGL